MSTTVSTIREKLHQYIDYAEDKKVKAIFTIVQTDMDEEDIYTAEFKAELDSRYSEYKAGKAKTITLAESKKSALNKLKEKSKK